jgi:nucleoid-associated protein YgaU
MTHIVQFNAGDSLPLLCHRIYDDATQYAAVARHNDITNFREIAPGTRIVFPPLR